MSFPAQLTFLILPLFLCPMPAAGKSSLPLACPPAPVVNGFRTVTVEGGKMRLRLPAAIGLTYSPDCKQVHHISVTYTWREGKLSFPHPSPAYDQFVQVYPTVESLDRARLDAARYRYEGPVLPHRIYPLDLNARVVRSRDPLQPGAQTSESFEWKVWSVRGTFDPISQSPFTADCQISALDRVRPETAVNGDFPHNNPDARCRISVRAVKSDKVIWASVHVWARNAPYIDQISRAVAAELQTYILED